MSLICGCWMKKLQSDQMTLKCVRQKMIWGLVNWKMEHGHWWLPKGNVYWTTVCQLVKRGTCSVLVFYSSQGGKESLKDQGYKWKTNMESCKVKNTERGRPQGKRIIFQFKKKKKHKKTYNLSCKLIPHLIFEIPSYFSRLEPIRGKWNVIGKWQPGI